MRRSLVLILPLTVALLVVACATYDSSRISRWEARFRDGPPGVTPDQLLAETRVKLDLIPPGTVGRRYFRP